MEYYELLILEGKAACRLYRKSPNGNFTLDSILMMLSMAFSLILPRTAFLVSFNEGDITPNLCVQIFIKLLQYCSFTLIYGLFKVEFPLNLQCVTFTGKNVNIPPEDNIKYSGQCQYPSR